MRKRTKIAVMRYVKCLAAAFGAAVINASPSGLEAPFAKQVASISSLSSIADATVSLEDIERLNAEILWAPASASSNPVTRFGDEARAVFGPLPDGDCAGPTSRRLRAEVDGNLVDLEPNVTKEGSPLEFVHRDLSGAIVKWTADLPKCDKPSLAGGVTFCGINSRIARAKVNHVEWLFLCRKSSDSLEVRADPYWTALDPRFSRYSAIGFNDLTGEIAFLDGRKDRKEFDWSKPFPAPGGRSYSDEEGRQFAEQLYDGTFQVDCVSCHDNKKPTIIDPHVQQARVGYFEGKADPRAVAFSLGSFISGRSAREELPFRVVGSDYSAKHEDTFRHARAVAIEGHPCSACHSLTTLESGKRFAADAVGRPPIIENPTFAQNVVLFNEKFALRLVQEHRTEWATVGGAGRIQPWMVPEDGGNLSKSAFELSDAEWLQLSECAWGSGGAACGYKPLFTGCQPPGQGADIFVPFDLSADIAQAPEKLDSGNQVMRVTWKYRNGYGEVSQRDDVRFNIAVRISAIPKERTGPKAQEYPTLDEAKAANYLAVRDNIGKSGESILLQNATSSGHIKWTDPQPSNEARPYSIDIPAICGERYLIRILPKRFCFDYTGVIYGDTSYTIYRDFNC